MNITLKIIFSFIGAVGTVTTCLSLYLATLTSVNTPNDALAYLGVSMASAIVTVLATYEIMFG